MALRAWRSGGITRLVTAVTLRAAKVLRETGVAAATERADG